MTCEKQDQLEGFAVSMSFLVWDYAVVLYSSFKDPILPDSLFLAFCNLRMLALLADQLAYQATQIRCKRDSTKN